MYRRAVRSPALIQQFVQPRPLVALDVEEKGVRRAFTELHREVPKQIHLNALNRQDEERAESHREENDARLIPGTAEVQHRVTQGERG